MSPSDSRPKVPAGLAGWAAAAASALVLAGCLSAATPRPEPHPVVSRDGRLRVAVERYRCACTGEPHFEAYVRACRARGPYEGTTAWIMPLDGEGAGGPIAIGLEGVAGGEVVVVHAPGRVRRFRLSTGERLD